MIRAVGFNGRLEIDDIDKIIEKRHLQPGGRVQQYIDSEVIRRCDRRVPVDSHALRKSAKIHSEIGSGEVRYVTPYAKREYYENTGASQHEPLRKGLWFLNMKNAEKDEILEGARKIAGEL